MNINSPKQSNGGNRVKSLVAVPSQACNLATSLIPVGECKTRTVDYGLDNELFPHKKIALLMLFLPPV